MGRAVHRLEGEDAFALVVGREHVLAELLPVARALPQHPVDHLGRPNLDIAGPFEPRAHIVLAQAVERPAVGMPEHAADGLLLDMEQFHLPAEAAMVAPFGLFQQVQPGL